MYVADDAKHPRCAHVARPTYCATRAARIELSVHRPKTDRCRLDKPLRFLNNVPDVRIQVHSSDVRSHIGRGVVDLEYSVLSTRY